jgi:hypothetical protein
MLLLLLVLLLVLLLLLHGSVTLRGGLVLLCWMPWLLTWQQQML